MGNGPQELKGEILRYLERHTSAAETAQGITHWWLSRQRLEEAVEAVDAALAELVAEAKLERHVLADTTVVYRAKRDPSRA